MIGLTLVFSTILLWGLEVESSVLVADMTMSRMVELNAGAPFCALYHDRGIIQQMILGADPKKVRQMSSNLIDDLEETCKESRNKGKNQPPGGGLIYPGTKWCGPGNIAASYDDLGHHANEDACCREHDHCPVVILPRSCIHGICNTSPFTRSHCDCDAKFRRCLQNLNTEVANTLGALFFNVVQVTCFKERRPCSQWQSSSCANFSNEIQWKRSPRYYPADSERSWTIGRRNSLLNTLFSVVADGVRARRRTLENVEEES